MTPRRVTVYSGSDCCLCDQAIAMIERVSADVPLALEVVDIHADPALAARYRTSIPVVAVDGEVVMEGKVTEFWLRKALAGEAISRFRLL